MRVMLRSGGALLMLGAMLAGCEQPASSPQKSAASAPGKNGPATAKAADTDYVLGVSGMA
jgi:hypothetical protein